VTPQVKKERCSGVDTILANDEVALADAVGNNFVGAQMKVGAGSAGATDDRGVARPVVLWIADGEF